MNATLDDLDPLTALSARALEYAASEAAGDATGHDFTHIGRVFAAAQRIADAEGADRETVELIAALHDVKDFKFTGDVTSGFKAAQQWLLGHEVAPARAERIAADVGNISFKGAGTPVGQLTLEGKCVQDADRLDAMGAVGIARCFAYGGKKGRPIYDVSIEVMHHATTEQYLAHQGTSINHFHEKLLLIRDRLHTETARRIGQERHAFMEQFLDQFYREVTP